jgi:peptidoglycan/xylan/chitin deacetylase (PgdA/CDA1 family)
MSLRHFRSPFYALMFGYLLFAILAATLAVFAPLPGQEIAAPDGSNDVLVTSAIKVETPQCDPALSLAGRELTIDPTGGPHFGTVQFPQSLPLNDKEVVLTFDDGPHPTRTPAILDVLDRYCVKAVFFVVGEMVMEHADVLRDIARRGHVIGSHTFTHPFLTHLSKEQQAREIDGGFAAVSHVLGGPVAPLFRFPYLAHSPQLLSEMATRNISVWSVDVITGDSYFSAHRLTDRLFDGLARQGHGIVLMHDIKKATAEILADILGSLKEKGYTVPRVTVAPTLMPDEQLLAAFDETKPHWPSLIRHASQRSGNAQVANRSPARIQHVRPDVPVFQEQ